MRYGASLRTRQLLKTLHTLCASAWIGGGFAVLVMLFNDRHAANGDELYAFNYAIRTIDDYIIVPAAAGSALTGLLLCLLTNWGLFRHRWVMAKWGLTLAAIAFGAVWLGPWLKDLSEIAGIDRLAVFDNGGYFRSYRFGVIFGVLQTLVLLVLLLLSIFKPGLGGSARQGDAFAVPCRMLPGWWRHSRVFAALRSGRLAGTRG